jgi:hypothetical protein
MARVGWSGDDLGLGILDPEGLNAGEQPLQKQRRRRRDPRKIQRRGGRDSTAAVC